MFSMLFWDTSKICDNWVLTFSGSKGSNRINCQNLFLTFWKVESGKGRDSTVGGRKQQLKAAAAALAAEAAETAVQAVETAKHCKQQKQHKQQQQEK